jgi:tRNA G18 (ribose-2'-O)-methylase SpoU
MMPIEDIHDLDDPRLAPYRSLKQTNLTRWSGLFIAEGEKVVRRLLTSRYVTQSILLSDRKSQLADDPEFAGQQVFILPQPLAEELVGYGFHAGVLACGERPPAPSLAVKLNAATSSEPKVAVVCPHITDPDNLGTIIRLCAGFGANPLILGPGSADPFSRRTLRVSMGYALHLAIIESEQLHDDLRLLKSKGFMLAATVLSVRAEPLHTFDRRDRIALLFGNEAEGLADEWVSACDVQLTIPMSGGTDSLNVALAAGIFLHHFCR